MICLKNSDAHYETEAVIDHMFYHKNTAPFIAVRLIQRFGVSNPSPRYIHDVANSFISGIYRIQDVDFGTGDYGDLSATVAAILLDREGRNSLLDVDFSHGGLREPLLKVVAAMRGLEYQHRNNIFTFPSLYQMETKIGQMAHHIPSVFSFFLPEYAPPGVIKRAGLVSPEAMLLYNTFGLVNGLTSLVDFG